MKRVFTLILALAIALMPTALAESYYGALTVSNFHVDIDGSEPLDIPMSVKIGLGGNAEGDTGRLDLTVAGNDTTAFSGSVGATAEGIRALIDGADFYLEVPYEDVEKAAAEMAESEGVSIESSELLAADSADLMPFIEKLIALNEKYSDPEKAKEISSKMVAGMDLEAKGAEEVDFFGEKVTLNRFDLSLNAKEFGDFYEKAMSADPDMKDLMDAYLKLLAQMSAAEGEEIPSDITDMMETMTKELEEQKIDLQYNYSFWVDTETLSDPDAKMVKESLTAVLTNLSEDASEEGEDVLKTVTIPVNVSVKELEQGSLIAGDMVVEPYEGESATFNFDGSFEVPNENGGTDSTMNLNFSFHSEESVEDITFTAALNDTKDAEGVRDLSVTLDGVYNDDAFSVSAAYDGTSATETEKAGTVTLIADIPSEDLKATFSFETLLETSDYAPIGEEELANLTKINPVTADEDTLEDLELKLQGVAMQALGVLMQTPGLSDIIADAM